MQHYNTIPYHIRRLILAWTFSAASTPLVGRFIGEDCGDIEMRKSIPRQLLLIPQYLALEPWQFEELSKIILPLMQPYHRWCVRVKLTKYSLQTLNIEPPKYGALSITAFPDKHVKSFVSNNPQLETCIEQVTPFALKPKVPATLTSFDVNYYDEKDLPFKRISWPSLDVDITDELLVDKTLQLVHKYADRFNHRVTLTMEIDATPQTTKTGLYVAANVDTIVGRVKYIAERVPFATVVVRVSNYITESNAYTEYLNLLRHLTSIPNVAAICLYEPQILKYYGALIELDDLCNTKQEFFAWIWPMKNEVHRYGFDIALDERCFSVDNIEVTVSTGSVWPYGYRVLFTRHHWAVQPGYEHATMEHVNLTRV